MWVMILERLALEFIWHLVFFPIWWYSIGAKQVAMGCWRLFQAGNMQLAPGLWLRNLFVPMYGQSDWQGRIMSIFIRLANVIIRGAALLVWLLIVVTLWLAWLAWPVFVAVSLGRAVV